MCHSLDRHRRVTSMFNGMTNIPNLEVNIDLNNHNRGVVKILQQLKPKWKLKDIRFRDISGHFNKLFLCTHRRLGTADGVVLRAFGPNMNKYVDHTAELTCMQIMRDFCGGAAVLARFENGIAYTYIDGKCFDIEMMTSVHYGSIVAKQMAAMHAISAKKVRTRGFEIDGEPVLFKRLREHCGMLDAWREDFEKFTDLPSVDDIIKEAVMLEMELTKLDCPVALCHNDLQTKNIIYNWKGDQAQFIDFETAGFNFIAFDIGNYFCEWAPEDNSTLDFSQYPTRDAQLSWLRNYFVHKVELDERLPQDVSDVEMERYYVMANKFALASHLLYGIWSLLETKFATINFDFHRYSKARFDEYFAKKDTFLAL